LSLEEDQERREAKRSLKFPPVQFTGKQAQGIGKAFGDLARNNNYTFWACSILPEHMHLVIARHTYGVESVVNLLKGAATRELIDRNLHPLAAFAEPGLRPPKMWARRLWKVYLDSEEAILNAMRYVVDNPTNEGKPQQTWSFVSPFRGLEPGLVIYH